jgi:hypothetical protein
MRSANENLSVQGANVEETQHEEIKEIAEKKEAPVAVVCRICGSNRVFRLYREGLLQERFFPIFGFYPWHCKACSASMMLRKRGKRKRTPGTH